MANEFVEVDISDFFDNYEQNEKLSTGIELFTQTQLDLIDKLLPELQKKNNERYIILKARITELEKLASAISLFPSLFDSNILGGTQTPESLIDSLIAHQDDGDATLRLPSKAALGKSLLIAKIHTFSSMARISFTIGLDEKTSDDFSTETARLMFSLLAEDVYLNCVRDSSLDIDLRRKIARSLILLWEHRADQAMTEIAPVLQRVWTARRKLAPAFGTMMGTSELLLISIQMGSRWSAFIKECLGDQNVSQAMEEFLFGISYEQINKLRGILRTKGVMAIGRDEVSKFLGVHVKTDVGLDYRDFYSMYTIRRDNARARHRMNLEGPHKTLEDYFIQFVLKHDKTFHPNANALEPKSDTTPTDSNDEDE